MSACLHATESDLFAERERAMDSDISLVPIHKPAEPFLAPEEVFFFFFTRMIAALRMRLGSH